VVAGEESLARKFSVLWPHLDERQRRLVMGVEAREWGRGGISAVARAARVSLPTVRKAMREIDEGLGPTSRVRRPGGGRKRSADKDPGLVAALEAMVDPATRGDPESPLRWTTKSTRQLAGALSDGGHPASSWTVGRLLHGLDYSLQGARKTIEGTQHPDRDAQFGYINDLARRFLRAQLPVISVDTKKKELVGRYRNGGREWQPKGHPERVKVHDFIDRELGKAIPYGIYDIGADQGWVSVGQDHDTAAFAVEAIRRWWSAMGAAAYPRARQLLICADAGGSNGYRNRLWKLELHRLAVESGLTVTVCHFPPGTSKWNRIEHRLFAHISMNWRGQPLTSHEVIVDLIGATTTRTGLTVHAEHDSGTYPAGVKVTDAELAAVNLRPHGFHGDWNYSIDPPKHHRRLPGSGPN
jgi:Rhodopirellula transposase DDE domain